MAFLQGNTKYTGKQCILIIIHNVWFQKLSIPPPPKVFFLRPPPHPPPPHRLSGNSSQASYIYLSFWAFENPPPPRNFQSLPLGEYGYFLELHNCKIISVSIIDWQVPFFYSVSKIYVFNLEVYH